MSLKQLIKKYPVTIAFTLTLSILMGTLFVEAKVYAASESKGNNPDCDCVEKLCNTNINCVNGKCPLVVLQYITTDCEISHSKSCKRVRGCGCSECENIKDCDGRCNDYCGEKCLIRQVRAVYGCDVRTNKCDYDIV